MGAGGRPGGYAVLVQVLRLWGLTGFEAGNGYAGLQMQLCSVPRCVRFVSSLSLRVGRRSPAFAPGLSACALWPVPAGGDICPAPQQRS